MNELLERLSTYLAAVVRYRWYAAAIAAVVCLAGWTIVGLLPDQYRASARIYVDTKTVLQPLLKGLAVEPDVAQEIAAMQQGLLSRPNLEEVIHRASLDTGSLNQEQREALVVRLRKAITVGASGQSMFIIDVVWTTAEKAAELAQTLVDVFVESSVGLSREDMEQASRFLDGQITEYEQKLEAAESRAAVFKQENLAFLASEKGFQSNLDSARQRESSIASDLRDARTEVDILKSELAATPQTIEPGSSAVGDEPRLARMQARLAELLTRYTEKHPDVIALRRKIEDGGLIDDPSLDIDDGKAPSISIAAVPVPNPAYASLKLRLVDKGAEVAKLQEKLKLAQREVLDLESRAYQAPEVEARMAKLNRDYSVLKSQYEELLSRRELAKVSRDRDEKGDKVQFRVIDPPRVPVLPQGPNRPLLLTAVLPIACAAGLGFAVALSLLRGTYSSSRQLEADFGLPVIGSVSFVRPSGTWARHRMEAVGLTLLSACLLVTYALLMTLETRIGLGKIVSIAIESHSIRPPLNLVFHGIGAVLPSQDAER